jgi:hypothetical protein
MLIVAAGQPLVTSWVVWGAAGWIALCLHWLFDWEL